MTQAGRSDCQGDDVGHAKRTAANADEPVRLVRFAAEGTVATGLVEGEAVVALSVPWEEALRRLAEGRAGELRSFVTGPPQALASCELLPPVAEGSELLCVGLNYRAHEAEASDLVDALRPVPIIFAKSRRAVAGPGARLPLACDVSTEFDWEAELGVVVGREAVDIAAEHAWGYVAGYCVVNDITARDLQKRHQQWHLGKNVPASTPIGPWVVARDAVPSPPDLEVRLRVNGEVKQRARTSQLIHDIPTLLVLLSRVTTLRAGDVIATGTPAGVGYTRTPPEYLEDGDVVEASVEGVGTLTNVVSTAPRHDAAAVTAAPVALGG